MDEKFPLTGGKSDYTKDDIRLMKISTNSPILRQSRGVIMNT